MLADVKNVCKVLEVWGIYEDEVKIGWHDGAISIIINVNRSRPPSEGLKTVILEMIAENTSTSLPVIFEKDFRFNFREVS